MPQFEYCPPFEVYAGGKKGVKPVFETRSFSSALENLQRRRDSTLTVQVLVTDGEVSTLIPIHVSAADVKGKGDHEVLAVVEGEAERRFAELTSDRATQALAV